MCSICGGTSWNSLSRYIWENSEDRGRDDHGRYQLPNGKWIGNHRATPTTEVEMPLEKQPVGKGKYKIVFNGILSEADNLGIREGEADTSILPRVLDFANIYAFKKSVQEKLQKSSYAIAVLNLETGAVWLACNYKPIWIAERDGQYYFSSLAQHFPDAYFRPYRMPAYSVMELGNWDSVMPIKRSQSEKAIVICSSGLDSTAVAAYVVNKHGRDNVVLMNYDYGCRATEQEKQHVRKIAYYFGCDYVIQKMPSFGGSNLLDTNLEIAKGVQGAEYAHEWVPARNLVMLSLTTAYAEANNYGHIYLGTNLEEAGAYPDNEEQFIKDFDGLLYGAVQNSVKISVHTPLGGLMKHEIIPFGNAYDAPFHLTYSCYHGFEKHCGECGPCFMRKTAFERNNLTDPVRPYINDYKNQKT